MVIANLVLNLSDPLIVGIVLALWTILMYILGYVTANNKWILRHHGPVPTYKHPAAPTRANAQPQARARGDAQ